MDIGDSPATDPLQQLPNTESRPFLLGCYSFDLAFSVGIVVTQSFNIRRTQQFFSKVVNFFFTCSAPVGAHGVRTAHRARARADTHTHTEVVQRLVDRDPHVRVCVWGCRRRGVYCVRGAASGGYPLRAVAGVDRPGDGDVRDAAVCVPGGGDSAACAHCQQVRGGQRGDHAERVCAQAVAGAGPGRVDGGGVDGDLRVRRVGARVRGRYRRDFVREGICVCGQELRDGGELTTTSWLGVGSLLLVIVLDLGVSLATFNKVHRMLNTGERTLSWYMRALLPLPSQATLDRAGSVASNNTNNSSSNIAPGRTGHAMSADTRRVLRSWTMMTVGVISSALIFFFAWLFLTRSQAWVTAFRLFWLAGCIWQRGSLLYIDAIRHVAISNRASKRYLGTMTTTGIVFDTIKRRTSPVPEPKQAQENKS